MKKIESHKIELKPLTIKDADAAYHLFSLKEVADFYDTKPIEHNESAMVFTYRIIKGSNYIWKVTRTKDAETLIGICALHKWDVTNKTIEIGGTLLPKWWNQNIMGTAFKEVIAFAAEKVGVNQILARTSPTNIQAIKLVEKLGFQRVNLSVNEIFLRLNLPNESSILQKTIQCLNKEGCLLYPTDTVWGLGGNALSKHVFDKINTIKNRPAHKAYIVLIKSLEAMVPYVHFNKTEIEALLAKAEKPTTIIYPLKNKILQHLAAEDNTIAIRIPQHGFVKSLIQAIDFPIISTSANLSGTPSPVHFHDISKDIKKQVDYMVPYSAVEESRDLKEPSAILKIEPSGDISTIRK